MASRSQRERSWSSRLIGRAVGVGARRPPGVGEQQQGEQPVGLGRVGQQLDDEPGEPDRLVAQVGAHQRVAGGGDVALGVDEVQHVEHAAEPLGQLVVGGHAVGDAGGLHLALGPHEPLVHGRLGGQERPGDLGDLEAADGAEGERDASVERERGVAAGEQQAQPIVGDGAAVVAAVVAGRGVVLVAHECSRWSRAAWLATRVRSRRRRVDRPSPGDGGQPAAGPAGTPRSRPLRRGRGEGVGDGFLGEADVAAHLAGERREERGPLLAVRPLDGLVGSDRAAALVRQAAQASCSWLRQRTDLDGSVGRRSASAWPSRARRRGRRRR